MGYTRFFDVKLFLMDFSKYVAIFGITLTVYYALKNEWVTTDRMIHFIKRSGVLCLYITIGLLALYIIGFRSTNEIFVRPFGTAWGVWETGRFLPRLAGTTAEPQQLSIIFITPILLIMAKNKNKLSFIPLLGILVLFMSQSKFSFISIALVIFYLIIARKSFRAPVIFFLALLTPFIYQIAIKLPIMKDFLDNGMNAGAITERSDNYGILFGIIKEHPFFGIGAGQYGLYMQSLGADVPDNYYPNADLMKIFAEVGIVGFLAVIFIFAYLAVTTMRAYRVSEGEEKYTILALGIGTLAIFFNMFIGYEFLHVFVWINIGMLMYYNDKVLSSHKEEVVTNRRLALSR